MTAYDRTKKTSRTDSTSGKAGRFPPFLGNNWPMSALIFFSCMVLYLFCRWWLLLNNIDSNFNEWKLKISKTDKKKKARHRQIIPKQGRKEKNARDKPRSLQAVPANISKLFPLEKTEQRTSATSMKCHACRTSTKQPLIQSPTNRLQPFLRLLVTSSS